MEKKLLTIFGASGLVGSSILREALDKGYHVNGTLRDIEKQDRITRLKSLPSGNNADFFSADMAEISSLDNPLINSDAAIICCLIPTYKGFDGTPAKELDDERGYNEIIKPTVDGCLNILRAAKRNNVKNILICSSTSSTNPVPPVSIKNELDHWSDEKEQCNSKKYTSAAKTYMEKAAFKFCNENNLWLFIGGSISKTSNPAAKIFLFFKASYNASSLTIPPRAELIRIKFDLQMLNES